MVGIWSTVGKQAKGMPDTTVETTEKVCVRVCKGSKNSYNRNNLPGIMENKFSD